MHEKERRGISPLSVLGAALCVVLLPVLVTNCILIVKGYINQESVPAVGGWFPMIVLSDSMYPTIREGDLILCRTADPAALGEGDVISFFDPASRENAVVTHRVAEVVTTLDGTRAFHTKGDANSAEDPDTVPASAVVGVYRARLPGVGRAAMFMQTTAGFVVCVGVPLALLVAYDLLRRRQYEKSSARDTDELLAELEVLRREKARREEEPE